MVLTVIMVDLEGAGRKRTPPPSKAWDAFERIQLVGLIKDEKFQVGLKLKNNNPAFMIHK